MWGEDEDFIVYRRSGNSKENTQTSRLVGSEGKAAPQSQRATAKCPVRLLSPPPHPETGTGRAVRLVYL